MRGSNSGRVRVRVRVRAECIGIGLAKVKVKVRVRGNYRGRYRGGLLLTTLHSISYTRLNAEGLPSGGLSGDICRHRMGPHSNDAGTLAA